MAQTIVVVTFYSRSGATERLATAGAVGAVQARAGIRMRRLVDVDLEGTLERFPECGEHLKRMQKEYVPPREADLLAADVLIFGTPPDLNEASAVWVPFFTMLDKVRAEGKLLGKVAAVVGDDEAAGLFAAALGRLGLHALTTEEANGASAASGEIERAVALGSHAVTVAETLKQKAGL